MKKRFLTLSVDRYYVYGAKGSAIFYLSHFNSQGVFTTEENEMFELTDDEVIKASTSLAVNNVGDMLITWGFYYPKTGGIWGKFYKSIGFLFK